MIFLNTKQTATVDEPNQKKVMSDNLEQTQMPELFHTIAIHPSVKEEHSYALPVFDFHSHVIALRSAVIKSVIFFMIASSVSYCFSKEILSCLVKPLAFLFEEMAKTASSSTPHRFIYTNLTEAFLTYIKISLFSGLVISFPFMALQGWKFITPGLYTYEKKFFKYLLVGTPLLFSAGALFAYFIVIPTAFTFFLSFESNIANIPLQLESKISEYITLMLRLIFAFGLSFQLPIVLAGLSWLKLLSFQTLVSKWRWAVVGIALVSAVITPPDAISMIMLAVPLGILYTISILLVKHIEKYQRDKTQDA